MKLFSLVLALLLAFAVACGGDDGDSDDSAGQSGGGAASPTEAPSGGEGAPTQAPSDSGGGSGGAVAPGRAVVTVGDETFEFDMSLSCLTLFGAVGGSGRSADGSDISLDITIAPPEIDDSSIRIDDDREDRPVTWEADATLMETVTGVQPGQSQVDDFAIDGGTASGTATFIDSFAILAGESPAPVQGSFAINCGE